MTGEMSRDDVTRDAFPLHFAIADALGGTVHPFDVYQGPYVLAQGHRLWLIGNGRYGFTAVYSKTTGQQSDWFLTRQRWTSEPRYCAIEAAREILAGGGFDPANEAARNDALRLADIGEG